MKVLLLDQIARVNYKYSFSLANAIRTLGIEIELAADDIEDISYCQCRVNRWFITARKDAGKLRKGINYIASYISVLKKARSEHFNVVHLQWFQLSPVDVFFMKRLKGYGLDAIEAYYPTYTPSESKYIKTLAQKYALCLSGGSDFHGSIKPGLDLGTGYGKLEVPYILLEELEKLRG